MGMTREQIKKILEDKGLEVNVRLQGDQQAFKVTIKSSFTIPTENISEATVLSKTKSSIRGFVMSQFYYWYSLF